MQMTQCVVGIDAPQLSKIEFKDELYRDEKQGCYGWRWSFPRTYYRGRPDLASGVDRFDIRLDILDLTPASLLPAERREELLNTVHIRLLGNDKFRGKVAHYKGTETSIYHLQKTNHMTFGMEVYEETRVPVNQYKGYWLFQVGDVQQFTQCLSKPNETFEQWRARPQGGCTIYANVDDRVFIQYYLVKAQLPDMHTINDKLVGLVRSFMIAPPIQKLPTQERKQ